MKGEKQPVKQERPVNLDLTTIHFPIPAIASILHRISGAVLYLFIPFLLWMLQKSLRSQDSFLELKQILTNPLAKFLVWALLVGVIYHVIAGIRHLLMDIHVGDSLKGGRLSATLTIILTIVLSLLIGVFLW